MNSTKLTEKTHSSDSQIRICMYIHQLRTSNFYIAWYMNATNEIDFIVNVFGIMKKIVSQKERRTCEKCNHNKTNMRCCTWIIQWKVHAFHVFFLFRSEFKSYFCFFVFILLYEWLPVRQLRFPRMISSKKIYQ